MRLFATYSLSLSLKTNKTTRQQGKNPLIPDVSRVLPHVASLKTSKTTWPWQHNSPRLLPSAPLLIPFRAGQPLQQLVNSRFSPTGPAKKFLPNDVMHEKQLLT
jgi:hypothetical protein